MKLKTLLKLILILAFSFQLLAISYAVLIQRYIRVNILQDTASVRIKVNGSYEIQDLRTKRVLYRGKNLNTTVTSFKDNTLIERVSSPADKILIKSLDARTFMVNDRYFKGDVQILRQQDQRLSVINYIELEDYVKGILYHEASHYWPMEALKAQAITCRTYAVYQMRENRLKDYDVTSDIYSQVYGGFTSERYRTNKAVDETSEKILTYQDKVFPAYFHATCAGHTEDASLLWNIDIAPLKGVACSFCKESPHFNWNYVVSKKEIEEKLVKAGYNISNIKEIIIMGRDKSGRIIELKIRSPKKEVKITAKDFRNIASPNLIKSTNFNLSIINDDLVFEGFGWGHGVGLCQWGAYFMAKKGFSAGEILKFYYPQSNVKNLGL